MKKNSISKNALWLIGGKVAQSAMALVISMMSARYLGPSNYGLINYATAIVAFVAPFMKLGFNHIIVQEIVNNPDLEGKTIGTIMFYTVMSSFMCVIGVATFVSLVNKGETETLIVCVLYSISLIFQATEMIQYWFQAKLISQYTSIVSFVAYVIVSLYKVYLLMMGKSVYWFAISQAIDFFVISIALIVLYNKLTKNKLEVSIKYGKALFQKSKYYILSSLMITIFAQTDKLMLKNYLGDEATGYYSAAITCVGITGFVFAAIIDSMRPKIIELKTKLDTEYKKMVSTLYCIIFYLSFVQCVFIVIFAKPIILLLYGKSFVKAIPVLRIAVWYVTYSYMGSVRDVWILAEEKQAYLWKINLLGALTNVVINAILIPYWGVNGAAIASFVTQFTTNFVLGFIYNPIKNNNSLMMRGISPYFLMFEIKKIVKLRICKRNND